MAGWIPGGAIGTWAQSVHLGGARSRGKKRRRTRRGSKRSARSASLTSGTRRRKKRSTGKPKPGTKAWMAYIRSKRGKKRK